MKFNETSYENFSLGTLEVEKMLHDLKNRIMSVHEINEREVFIKLLYDICKEISSRIAWMEIGNVHVGIIVGDLFRRHPNFWTKLEHFEVNAVRVCFFSTFSTFSLKSFFFQF